MTFQREASRFRNWIEGNSNAVYSPERNRYLLYVSLACPWASRCVGAIYLKKLDDIIGLSVVHLVFRRTRPIFEKDTHCGWTFADPKTTPTRPGPSDLYDQCTSEPTRYTVPLLGQEKPDDLPSKVYLYPEELQSEIDELNEWVHDDVILAAHRFLVGDRFSEADLRLFTTLVRFDEVYAIHFKASKQLIEQYPNLNNMPPIAKRVDMQQIKMHYYASHTHLNPTTDLL
ncbi:Glutathione S-transferase C-terminal domain [Phytophthora infestans]|uniref:Glutathione S-transferase C-terminal domain n=1 Tax=Phytophthora infestans TaxID=4787 RepID=A0A833SYZ8_PHYIN|nr:Glutathione S-transferase C-terminal domain [Phytophthora infestans]